MCHADRAKTHKNARKQESTLHSKLNTIKSPACERFQPWLFTALAQSAALYVPLWLLAFLGIAAAAQYPLACFCILRLSLEDVGALRQS